MNVFVHSTISAQFYSMDRSDRKESEFIHETQQNQMSYQQVKLHSKYLKTKPQKEGEHFPVTSFNFTLCFQHLYIQNSQRNSTQNDRGKALYKRNTNMLMIKQ